MLIKKICLLIFFFFMGNISLVFGDEVASSFTLFSKPIALSPTARFYTKNDSVFLSSYKGKVVVLNFWKPTCLKCLIEMPSLHDLKKRFGNDIVVLAIAEGDADYDTVKGVLHTQRQFYDIPITLDKNAQLMSSVGAPKVPHTRLINKAGEMVGYIQGEANFKSEEIINKIQNLISEKTDF